MNIIKNTIGVYYNNETRIIISTYKWTLSLHRNLTSPVEDAFNNINLKPLTFVTLEKC